MNTKNPKYKEFLFLQREQDKLDKYYKSTQPKDTKGLWARRPIDYTEVKEVVTATIRHREYHGHRIGKYITAQKAVFAYPTDELVQLDNLLDICKRVRSYKGNNLQGVSIDESEYNSLPERLQLYFYKHTTLDYVRTEEFEWVKDKKIEWFINSEGKSESRYIDALVKKYKYIYVNKVSYLYKYNTEIKYVDDIKYVYRYHILSDIKEKYDYFQWKEEQLAQKGGFYGNPYPKRWKKQSHKKSRVYLKRTLNKAIKYEDYDICSSNEKYHLPHCDRWIWY